MQSSLYYVHFDSVQDYEFLSSDDIGDEDPHREGPQTGSPLSSQSTIQRKPLIRGVDTALLDRPELPPRPLSDTEAHTVRSIGQTQLARKPILPKPQAIIPDKSPLLPERGLHGPRPIRQRFLSVDGVTLQSVPDRRNMDVRRWSEHPTSTAPQFPPRPVFLSKDKVQKAQSVTFKPWQQQESQEEDMVSAEHCWDWEKQWADRGLTPFKHGKVLEVSQDPSLTLIRRYDGKQWNVGRIVANNSDSTRPGAATATSNLSIEILTDSYSKFCGSRLMPSEQRKPVPEYSCMAALDAEHDFITSPKNRKTPRVFQRSLRMPGRTIKRSAERRPIVSGLSAIERARPSLEGRGGIVQGIDEVWPPVEDSTDNENESRRPYHLLSPWNGNCEFISGIAGRSLRCKHSFPSQNTSFGPGIHAATVSELRFNLPSSTILGSPVPKSPLLGTPRETKRSSLFARHQSRGSFSSFVTKEIAGNGYFGSMSEPEERLDLSLGQEHAGGGFGGKQAKMGKLIIQNEGLQMLDLIVAANMALWWKVYERFT